MLEKAVKEAMIATKKSPAINDLLSKLAGKDRRATITQGGCMTCDTTGITVDSFRDALSIKEYTISGMCQSCQDGVFE